MRRSSRRARVNLALVLAGAALAAGAPGLAHAGPSDPSSARKVALQLGLGPAVGIPGGGLFGRAPLDVEFHLRGGDVGPAIGAWAPMHFGPGSFGMNLGPVLLWDFRLGQVGAAKLYVAPLAATGYGFTAGTHGHGAAHFWFLTLGAQLRALWNDKIGLFVRPANFDLWVGNGWAAGNWSATLGLALAF